MQKFNFQAGALALLLLFQLTPAMAQTPAASIDNTMAPTAIDVGSKSPLSELWADQIGVAEAKFSAARKISGDTTAPRTTVSTLQTTVSLGDGRRLLFSTFFMPCHGPDWAPIGTFAATSYCPLRVALVSADGEMKKVADIPNVCIAAATDFETGQYVSRQNIRTIVNFDEARKTFVIRAFEDGETACRNSDNPPVRLDF